jgi:serine/threonine protein kinase
MGDATQGAHAEQEASFRVENLEMTSYQQLCPHLPTHGGIPAEPDRRGRQGTFGQIWHLDLPADGDRVLLKVAKQAGTSDVSFIEEYNTLCALEGLDGRAPRAVAKGTLLVPSETNLPERHRAFVMEDMSKVEVDGQIFSRRSLSSIMGTDRDRLGVAAIADFGLELLAIIEALAEKEHNHADFSESNILARVVPDAGASGGIRLDHVCLIDFGQSKVFDAGPTPQDRSPRMGTLAFCAPETLPRSFVSMCCQDDELADRFAAIYAGRNSFGVDIWSLGAILYWLRTGSKPLFGASGRDITSETIRTKQFGLSLGGKHSRLDLSGGDYELDRVIRLCTTWDPKARESHLALIRRELERARDATLSREAATDIGSDSGAETHATTCWATEFELTEPQMSRRPDRPHLLVIGPDPTAGPREIAFDGVRWKARHISEPFDASLLGTGSAARGISLAIVLEGAAATSLAGWFDGCARLQEVRGIGNLDASSAGDLSAMFRGCTSLETADLSRLRLPYASDLHELFAGCTALREVALPDFPNARDLSGMFDGCSSLARTAGANRLLDLACLELRQVTSLARMFRNCGRLEEIDVSGLRASSAKDLSEMFRGCHSLRRLDATGIQVPHVDDVARAFEGCSRLARVEGAPIWIDRPRSSRDMQTGCLLDEPIIQWETEQPSSPAAARVDAQADPVAYPQAAGLQAEWSTPAWSAQEAAAPVVRPVAQPSPPQQPERSAHRGGRVVVAILVICAIIAVGALVGVQRFGWELPFGIGGTDAGEQSESADDDGGSNGLDTSGYLDDTGHLTDDALVSLDGDQLSDLLADADWTWTTSSDGHPCLYHSSDESVIWVTTGTDTYLDEGGMDSYDPSSGTGAVFVREYLPTYDSLSYLKSHLCDLSNADGTTTYTTDESISDLVEDANGNQYLRQIRLVKNDDGDVIGCTMILSNDAAWAEGLCFLEHGNGYQPTSAADAFDHISAS